MAKWTVSTAVFEAGTQGWGGQMAAVEPDLQMEAVVEDGSAVLETGEHDRISCVCS
jgi:hypothetical protein